MRKFLCAAIVALVSASQVWACSIPVFRYALERWELGSYETTIFHRGPLSEDLQKLAKTLTDPETKRNLHARLVDLDGKVPGDAAKQWERHGKDKPLPWVMVRSAESETKAPPIWAGEFNRDNMRKLVDSPTRQELVKRLAKGESSVVIFLASGNAEEDDRALKVVESSIKSLEKKIALPKQSAEGPQLRYDLPLKVSLSVLPLKRDDPAEALFVHFLLNCEEDVAEVKGPIAFPVFGRGRLLCSLYHKDLNEEQLANVCRFLCGACSCQVKELNPGVDLLLTVDWASLLEKRLLDK